MSRTKNNIIILKNKMPDTSKMLKYLNFNLKLPKNKKGFIPVAGLKWAVKKNISKTFKVGDLIFVKKKRRILGFKTIS